MSSYKGTVKWFNEKKGYGFVNEEKTGRDYFVHYSNINTNTKFKKLDQGNKVTFDIEETDKGPMAVKVTLTK